MVLAWHPAHIVGPARNTNVKPIFGAAPPVRILSFFMRGGAPWRMGHCWRIAISEAAAADCAEAINRAKRETGVEA